MVGCSKPIRAVIKKGNKTNLLLMKKFLKDKECPNNFFVELYGEQRVVKKCSRCNKCRHETLHKKEQKNYREPGLNFKNKIDHKLICC